MKIRFIVKNFVGSILYDEIIEGTNENRILCDLLESGKIDVNVGDKLEIEEIE